MYMSDTSIMSGDKCFNCMKPGHKAHECPREEKDWEIYNFDIDEFMCSRCGRWNHLVHECYASRDIYGVRLVDNGRRCPDNRTSWVTSKGINKNRYKKN